MKQFTVNIVLKIIDLNDHRNDILILVNEDGDFPNFNLNDEKELDKQLFENLCNFFDVEESFAMFNTKQLSEVYNKEDMLHVCYNLFSPSSNCTNGKFINFNKTSMELNKFTNHRTHS